MSTAAGRSSPSSPSHRNALPAGSPRSFRAPSGVLQQVARSCLLPRASCPARAALSVAAHASFDRPVPAFPTLLLLLSSYPSPDRRRVRLQFLGDLFESLAGREQLPGPVLPLAVRLAAAPGRAEPATGPCRVGGDLEPHAA